MEKFICLICKAEFSKASALAGHVGAKHHISMEEYTEKYILEGNRPKCPVCGTNTRFMRGQYKFQEYCILHANEARSKWSKENGYGANGMENWKRGLTKHDHEGIMAQSQKMSGSNNPQYGKKHLPEIIDKISKTKKKKTKMKKEQKEKIYLTEENLKGVLAVLFPAVVFIRDKGFDDGKEKYLFRPDYCNHELKLIVEFDGYNHYSNSKRIIADIKKNEIFKNSGYKTIRIPYFVQISARTIKHFFNLDVEYRQVFPHGFIDDQAMLPADFCSLGVEQFKKDLTTLPEDVTEEIKKSLKKKIEILGDARLVLPAGFEL